MLKRFDIKEIVYGNIELPVIDVRTPAEYEKGHLPGAVNIPLFTNEERAHVGTVYKQQSKDKAIELGYKYVTPKLNDYIEQSVKAAPKKKVIVHCWRGGMRSQSFAEHLNNNGFDASIIEGGYKAFRRVVLDDFPETINLKVLGGYTGSGKTPVLLRMKELGHQVLDLEGIANHKGSAFGAIGCDPQPTPEQFENNLYWEFKEFDLSKPIWLEDESSNIGRVAIQRKLFLKMRESKLYFLDIPKEQRSLHLIDDYDVEHLEPLADAINRISKRLGGEKTKKALEYLDNHDFFNVAMICLDYYDKYYYKGMMKRDSERIEVIKIDEMNIDNIIERLLEY